jgi:hypothetical protein
MTGQSSGCPGMEVLGAFLSGTIACDTADLLSDPERTPDEAFAVWFGVRYGEPDEEGHDYDAHAAESETAGAILDAPFSVENRRGFGRLAKRAR